MYLKNKISGVIIIFCFLSVLTASPAKGWIDVGVPLVLSEEEKEYLRGKKELVVSVPTNCPPYSVWKNSEGSGLALSILKELAAKSGVTLKYIPAAGLEASCRQIARRDADIGAAALSPDGAPLDDFIPYLNVPIQCVLHKDARILKQDKLVMAEVAGERFVTVPSLRKKNLKVAHYASALECLNALRSGQADFFVSDLYQLKSLMDTFVLMDLSSITLSRHSATYGFLLSEGADPRLFSALQKTIGSFSSTEINREIFKYSVTRDFQHSVTAYIYRHPFELICALVSLLFVITIALLTYVRIRVRQHEELSGYEDSYRMLADTFGEAGLEYDYLHDRLTLFGRQHSRFDIPHVVENFREELARGSLRLSLTPEEFEEMLNSCEPAKSYEAEFRCGMADGEWKWFRMIYIVVSTAASHRRPIRLIGCLSDIEAERRERDLLRDMGQRDALTGVLNRAAGERRIREALREGAPGSLLLIIDVDHFKRFNDRFGHLCGDDVLRQFGAALKEVFGDGALLCRWGGDEFVVFLRHAGDEETTVAEIERLRAMMSVYKFRGSETPVTLSIGGATAGVCSSLESLFGAADTALYAVKNRGRDGFIISGLDEDGNGHDER